MDACPFDVLHDAGNQHLLAIADRIDLDFLADQVLVDEDRVLRCQRDLVADVPSELVCAIDHLHRAAAKHVRRPDEDRVTDSLGNCFGIVQGSDCCTVGLRDVQGAQECFEPETILGEVDRLQRAAEDRRSAWLSGLARLIAVWPPNWTIIGGMFAGSPPAS